jgi:hypothetical protein
MLKRWAVIFFNTRSKKLHMDVCLGHNEDEVMDTVKQAYQDTTYKPLSATEVPE